MTAHISINESNEPCEIELTMTELDDVSGGILPFVGAAVGAVAEGAILGFAVLGVAVIGYAFYKASHQSQ